MEQQSGSEQLHDHTSLILPRVYRGIRFQKDDGTEKIQRAPLGYVFGIDHSFGNRAVWKLPGGHKKKKLEETPLQTALRELQEETGLTPAEKAFTRIGSWLGQRGDHMKILFCADIEETAAQIVKERGIVRNEEARFFTTDEFYKLLRTGNFMRDHYEKMVELGAFLPFGRDLAPAA